MVCAAAVTGNGDPEQTTTLNVTAGAMRALGVRPALGRELSNDDDLPGAARTALLSDGYWQRRFGGDPSVIGRTITVDGTPREVIGVLPPRTRRERMPGSCQSPSESFGGLVR